MPSTLLYICATCGMPKNPATGQKPTNPHSEALAARVAAQLADTPEVEVRLIKCLSLCNKPVAWALDNPERHATTFAPATTAEDMAATARLYLATPLGQKMPKKDLPPEVKPTLISRVPPFTL